MWVRGVKGNDHQEDADRGEPPQGAELPEGLQADREAAQVGTQPGPETKRQPWNVGGQLGKAGSETDLGRKHGTAGKKHC